MAQNLLSSGVSPEYLQALSAAYNQYFPQQQAYDPAMLQQWYGQQQAPMLPQNAAPTSVVGSLFGQQYPQMNTALGGGGADYGRGIADAWGNMPSEGRAAFFDANPAWGAAHARAAGLVGSYLQNAYGQPKDITERAIAEGLGSLALQAYGNFGKESGGIPRGGMVSPGMFGPSIDLSGSEMMGDLGGLALSDGSAGSRADGYGGTGPSADFGGFDRGDRGNY